MEVWCHERIEVKIRKNYSIYEKKNVDFRLRNIIGFWAHVMVWVFKIESRQEKKRKSYSYGMGVW